MAAKKSAGKNPDAYDWSQDEGLGFEGVTQDDLGIPFLIILQKLSPELDETGPKYQEGLVAGMIINSVTKEVYGGAGEPLEFVPCGYQKMFVEWTPREQGGGFVASHSNPQILEHCSRNDRGNDVLESGNIVVTTAYVFGFVLRGEDRVNCVISFTSTQLKKARQWLSLMMSIKLEGPEGRFTPPMFSHKYHISSVPEKNEKGSWYGWKLENAGLLDDKELIEEAKTAHKRIQSSGSGIRMLAARNESSEEFDRF